MELTNVAEKSANSENREWILTINFYEHRCFRSLLLTDSNLRVNKKQSILEKHSEMEPHYQ